MYSADEERIAADYTPLVRKMAKKYSGKCGLEVEDLRQESYLALILALRSFDPERKVPLGGYLKAKVEQAVWGYCRRELSRREVCVDDLILGASLGGEKDREVGEYPWAEIFQPLSPKQRKAIYLIYIADLSLEETGRRLNSTRQAVCRLKSRALERISETVLQKVD